jgi:hypothetical protein
MSAPSWSRLAAPFPPDAVRWHAVAIDEAGGRVRLAPHLDPERLRARLDEVAGDGGWSLRLDAWGAEGLVAQLAIGETVRSAVVRVAPTAGMAGDDRPLDPGVAATGAAWTAAAEAFGACLPVQVLDDGWVELEPAGREPLRRPEHALAPAGARDVAAPDADPSTALRPDVEPAGAGGEPDAGDREPKPEAHRVIDRLVDRLRDEGLGAEAARLVAGHGGYGSDPGASRELYAKLRALLLEGRVEA